MWLKIITGLAQRVLNIDPADVFTLSSVNDLSDFFSAFFGG